MVTLDAVSEVNNPNDGGETRSVSKRRVAMRRHASLANSVATRRLLTSFIHENMELCDVCFLFYSSTIIVFRFEWLGPRGHRQVAGAVTTSGTDGLACSVSYNGCAWARQGDMAYESVTSPAVSRRVGTRVGLSLSYKRFGGV
ncbi:hypothetical protein EVAR_82113_1 [Eumeta japonica]|uniref:Uncharacterized protein n=1 Tax=Eumeta variegata TaxID=151549 RepID=A0A4C1U1V8_EUMVA|nr:hypothetical protein EVAR_82113_1 [Eumeta japonica]